MAHFNLILLAFQGTQWCRCLLHRCIPFIRADSAIRRRHLRRAVDARLRHSGSIIRWLFQWQTVAFRQVSRVGRRNRSELRTMPWPEAEVAEPLSFVTRCPPRISKLSTLIRLTSIRTFIRSIVKVGWFLQFLVYCLLGSAWTQDVPWSVKLFHVQEIPSTTFVFLLFKAAGQSSKSSSGVSSPTFPSGSISPCDFNQFGQHAGMLQDFAGKFKVFE